VLLYPFAVVVSYVSYLVVTEGPAVKPVDVVMPTIVAVLGLGAPTAIWLLMLAFVGSALPHLGYRLVGLGFLAPLVLVEPHNVVPIMVIQLGYWVLLRQPAGRYDW